MSVFLRHTTQFSSSSGIYKVLQRQIGPLIFRQEFSKRSGISFSFLWLVYLEGGLQGDSGTLVWLCMGSLAEFFVFLPAHHLLGERGISLLGQLLQG